MSSSAPDSDPVAGTGYDEDSDPLYNVMAEQLNTFNQNTEVNRNKGPDHPVSAPASPSGSAQSNEEVSSRGDQDSEEPEKPVKKKAAKKSKRHRKSVLKGAALTAHKTKKAKEQRKATSHKRPSSPVPEPITAKRLKKSVPKSSEAKPSNAKLSTPAKQRIIGNPRTPTAALMKFSTDKYTVYDESAKNAGLAVTARFKSFSQFDGYVLVTDSTITAENFKDRVPTSGVRLDDRLVGIALLNYSAKQLHANWPADFDTAGMVRAIRVPLGDAYTVSVDVGEPDIDGNACVAAGEYYGWWRGLHCLMGKAGLDAGLYQIRPSYEKFKCLSMGWKIGMKALDA